nr:unnamed protein product [Haemonchus contortus]
MPYTTVLPLISLFFTYVEAQYGGYNPWDPYGPNYKPVPRNPYQYNGYNRWNPLGPDFNPIPPNTFQGGVFSPDWGKRLKERIEQQIKNNMANSGTGNGYGNGSGTGNIGVIINRGNGQTEQYYTPSPVAKMFYTFVLPLVFPFFTYVEAQYGAYNQWNPYGPNYNPAQQNPYQYNDYNRWNPFSPNFNPIPPGTFQGGVFTPDWGKKLQERIEQEVKSSLEH